MRRSLFRIAAGLVPAFLCLAAVQAPAQTATVSSEVIDATPDCYRGTTIFKADAESHQACVDAAKADALERKASANYGARTNSTWSVTYTPPPPPPDVRTWVRVGPEKTSGGVIQSYTLAAPALVRFGVGTRWFEKAMPAGRFACSTSTFGDPAPGSVKVCDREEVGPDVVPPVDPPVVVPPVEPPVVVPPTGKGTAKRGEFAGGQKQGATTVRSGETLTGRVISNPDGDCVTVAAGAVDFVIRENEIGPCGGKGINVLAGATRGAVLRNDIHDVSTGLYLEPGTLNPIDFQFNWVTNLKGPFPRGQMAQYNGHRGGTRSSKITCNVSDQTGSVHNVEDHINMFASSGLSKADPIEIAFNKLRGGSPTSNSGTAIIAGDGANDAQQGNNFDIHHNVAVNVRNVCYAVAGGRDSKLRSNICFMQMPAAGYVNVGSYVWNQYPAACSGHEVSNNRTWVSNSNPYWYGGGNCGAVAGSGNVWSDASLTPAVFDLAIPECQ